MKETPQQPQQPQKGFWLTDWAVNNDTSVFILTLIIIVFGLISYAKMPKEQFPEIRIPMVYVNTIYPGNSPVDVENLVTRHIEKQLKSVKGVKKITSTSAQDISAVVVEFNENVDVSKAVQDTKDAVDKAKKDLPKDLDQDPSVTELDFSEIPIMTVNLSGDFEVDKLKDYAEYLEDEIEELPEVARVDIAGSLEREIQINADPFKMDARQVTFGDIEQAISAENLSMSAGDVLTGGYRRSLRLSGEFTDAEQIRDVIVKSDDQQTIYLKDIAEVRDSYVERKSFARLGDSTVVRNGTAPVVSLKVIKRGGENLIFATEKINSILAKAQKEVLPSNLNMLITESQSTQMEADLTNLENNIIIGVILVVMVLLFFMGLRNALLVGTAIPLSMLMSFSLMGLLGITINMVVLFALVLALGMLVDNAIVIVENIYRLREEGLSSREASKQGAGEVAIAIISSTATTLAAFVPLSFWGGIMGEFMKYLPITLIIVLSSSLFVGLVINPVLAKRYMSMDHSEVSHTWKKKALFSTVFLLLAIPSYFVFETYTAGNILLTFALFGYGEAFLFKPMAYWFQSSILVRLEHLYKKVLNFSLSGRRPYWVVGLTGLSLVLSVVLYGSRTPLVYLFPESSPNYVYLYLEMPLGTDVLTTDKAVRQFEQQLFHTLQPYAQAIDAVVTNVGENVNDPNAGPQMGTQPNKARISIAFVPFEKRGKVDSNEVLKACAEMAKQVPGIKIVTDKEQNGPPVGKPINIELVGTDYKVLIREAERMKQLIEASGIPGIDKLSLDINVGKPELMVNIDRNKARRYGVSTGQLAMDLRTSLYGKEVSKFKDGDDDYPIQLRLKDEYRYSISSLADQRIAFRDNKGRFHQVPVSAVADLDYSSSVGEVKRKDLDRLVTLSSNVSEGYNPNLVVGDIKRLLENHELPEGYAFKFTGEQEEQQKSMEFLSNALLIAVAAITLILVSQFNSWFKPLIIMTSVVFSLIGVLLGMAIFNDPFVIIMTGIGIISLAGVVVNNAIVLVDYTAQLEGELKAQKGMDQDDMLNVEEVKQCLEKAGFTRLRPVLLTAITTVLGLVPMAYGINFDFVGLYRAFEPNFYIGGMTAEFWSPMAWTVIYGLIFSTFLTLVVVPVNYLLVHRLTTRFKGKKSSDAGTATEWQQPAEQVLH